MKILLINAPYPSYDQHITEPLGLEYLASSLIQAGHKIDIYDPNINSRLSITIKEEILSIVKARQPDVIGISIHYEESAELSYNIATIIKENYPIITIVIGGLHVSLNKGDVLINKPAFDCAIIGEAEESIVKLLSDNGFIDVDGLIWRHSSYHFIIQPKKNYIKDLDKLPFPYRDYPLNSIYKLGSKTKNLYGLGFKPALSILTSSSCPNQCTFCNMKTVHGATWRARTPENVLDEVREINNKYNAKHMFIMDDNFTLNIDRAKKICEGMTGNDINIRWNTPNGISVKGIDNELVALMKVSGCANVSIAIESGEYIRNEVIKKGISDQQIIDAVKLFNKWKIPVVGYVIVGMPGETEERYNELLKLLLKLNLTSIVVSYATPFKGTVLYDEVQKIGIDINPNVGSYNEPTFQTKDFTKGDLIRRKEFLKRMFPSLSILREIEYKRG